jgi:hypothetical protein
MKKAAKRGKTVAKRKKKGAKGTKKSAAVEKGGGVGGVWYAYGIVRSDFKTGRGPAGLDDTLVEVTGVVSGGRGERIGALVSRLSAKEYDAKVVEESSGDVSWLSPRAMAHDRVLTWAQEHGGVIPLPMFSLWCSEAALSQSLIEQASDLTRAFERVSGADEFGLRVHRRDAVMLDAIDDLDPAVAALRREAQSAPPGQRYLLERKIAEQGKTAVRVAGQRMAKQIFDELSVFAREALLRPLVPDAAGSAHVPDATLVLNAAFLVDRKRLDEFRAAVGSRVRDYQPRGLAFDFTGPWPPYNFVGQAGTSALRSSKGTES